VESCYRVGALIKTKLKIMGWAPRVWPQCLLDGARPAAVTGLSPFVTVEQYTIGLIISISVDGKHVQVLWDQEVGWFADFLFVRGYITII